MQTVNHRQVPIQIFRIDCSFSEPFAEFHGEVDTAFIEEEVEAEERQHFWSDFDQGGQLQKEPLFDGVPSGGLEANW